MENQNGAAFRLVHNDNNGLLTRERNMKIADLYDFQLKIPCDMSLAMNSISRIKWRVLMKTDRYICAQYALMGPAVYMRGTTVLARMCIKISVATRWRLCYLDCIIDIIWYTCRVLWKTDNEQKACIHRSDNRTNPFLCRESGWRGSYPIWTSDSEGKLPV